MEEKEGGNNKAFWLATCMRLLLIRQGGCWCWELGDFKRDRQSIVLLDRQTLGSKMEGADKSPVDFPHFTLTHLLSHLWQLKCLIQNESKSSPNSFRGKLHLFFFLFCPHYLELFRGFCFMTLCHNTHYECLLVHPLVLNIDAEIKGLKC